MKKNLHNTNLYKIINLESFILKSKISVKKNQFISITFFNFTQQLIVSKSI